MSNVPAFFPSCWTALIRPVLLVLVSRCSHRCYSAVSVWSSVHRTLLPHCTHGLQSCALQFKAKMLRFSYFIVLYCKICLFMCHSKSARKRSPVNKVARSLEKNKTKIMKYLQQFSVALHYIMLIVVFVVTEETLWGQEMRTFIYLFFFFCKNHLKCVCSLVNAVTVCHVYVWRLRLKIFLTGTHCDFYSKLTLCLINFSFFFCYVCGRQR